MTDVEGRTCGNCGEYTFLEVCPRCNASFARAIPGDVRAQLARIEEKVEALDTLVRETIAGINDGIGSVMGNGLLGRILGRGREAE